MNAATPDTFRLFVYGTLKRGGLRRHYLAGQRFLGEAVTLPGHALYDLGAYPGMVARLGAEVVRGELYQVTAGLRVVLDRVEGAPTLFALGPVGLEGVEGPVLAYFYQGDVAGRRPLASGVWPR